MQAVILAGGLGTRLAEETSVRLNLRRERSPHDLPRQGPRP